VYISPDTHRALLEYLQVRPRTKARQVFLVEKSPYTGKPLSVRGIQKRMEYYARKTRVTVGCHHLRHPMATQLLNADAALVSIQDLLGHSPIKTTQRYCRVSNLKVKRDYYKAMEVVMPRTLSGGRAGGGGSAPTPPEFTARGNREGQEKRRTERQALPLRHPPPRR